MTNACEKAQCQCAAPWVKKTFSVRFGLLIFFMYALCNHMTSGVLIFVQWSYRHLGRMSGSQWKGRKDYLRWYYNSTGPPFLLSRSLPPKRHRRYLFGVAFAELRQGKSRLRTLWLINRRFISVPYAMDFFATLPCSKASTLLRWEQ